MFYFLVNTITKESRFCYDRPVVNVLTTTTTTCNTTDCHTSHTRVYVGFNCL